MLFCPKQQESYEYTFLAILSFWLSSNLSSIACKLAPTLSSLLISILSEAVLMEVTTGSLLPSGKSLTLQTLAFRVAGRPFFRASLACLFCQCYFLDFHFPLTALCTLFSRYSGILQYFCHCLYDDVCLHGKSPFSNGMFLPSLDHASVNWTDIPASHMWCV